MIGNFAQRGKGQDADLMQGYMQPSKAMKIDTIADGLPTVILYTVINTIRVDRAINDTVFPCQKKEGFIQ